MTMRLTMISHAATPAMRQGRFPADDSLDARSIADVAAWRARAAVPAMTSVIALSSPARCALETADALGVAVRIAPELADMDYGRWRGLRLADAATDTPAELEAWTCDPDAVAHGGESFNAVRARVGRWLDALTETNDVVAFTHAVVIRAAMLHVLDAPSSAFARVEVAPLSVVELRRSARGWAWWAA